MTMTTWPKNADGTNKRMGDMTREEQREQIAASTRRIFNEFGELSASRSVEADIYEHGGGATADEIAADLG
jgi:hypothetical protein